MNGPVELIIMLPKTCNYFSIYLYSISPYFDIYYLFLTNIYLRILTLQKVRKRFKNYGRSKTRRKPVQLIQCKLLPSFVESIYILKQYITYQNHLYKIFAPWAHCHCNHYLFKIVNAISKNIQKLTAKRNE